MASLFVRCRRYRSRLSDRDFTGQRAVFQWRSFPESFVHEWDVRINGSELALGAGVSFNTFGETQDLIIRSISA